jgi:hypothetical protein
MLDKRANQQLSMAGGENFGYSYIGPWYNRKLVKTFQGNGFQYYTDPRTGQDVIIGQGTPAQVEEDRRLRSIRNTPTT